MFTPNTLMHAYTVMMYIKICFYLTKVSFQESLFLNNAHSFLFLHLPRSVAGLNVVGWGVIIKFLNIFLPPVTTAFT